jgi:hypothetical protein
MVGPSNRHQNILCLGNQQLIRNYHPAHYRANGRYGRKNRFCLSHPPPGTLADLDKDLDVDFADYSLLLKDFGFFFSIFDFNRVVSFFGRLFNF